MMSAVFAYNGIEWRILNALSTANPNQIMSSHLSARLIRLEESGYGDLISSP